MIKVSLIAKTSETPTNLISHAAKTCYTSKVPEMGNTMDVENNLFKTGHHTTLQHNYYTFNIEGLSISSTIFGLHLTHPFYNTDQRSGRFSKMYAKPDFEEIKSYILKYWPNCDIENILSFIKKGTEIYQANIEKATQVAIDFIKEERPFATEEYITMNAPKIAQEQLRMFISTIAPTALDISVNLSVITALWRSAWSLEMREITNQMRDLILNEYADLAYMFNEEHRRNDNWSPKMDFTNPSILKEPQLLGFDIELLEDLNLKSIAKDSVDLRYFTPENMNNTLSFIKSRIEVSLATMGQDQRHRTIKRGIPELNGHFYLPPILEKIGLEKTAQDFLNEYTELIKNLDKNLALAIAPYGIMSTYSKYADLNGAIHEQEKRLCWSAQEEIYNLSRQLHEKLLQSGNDEIAELMTPACYKKACIEGRRYCGRDVSKLKNDKNIPRRKI
ncbi:MAG TPA: FAD-dependent thymidylate synthase [Rickettsiales bacterium]|nr:FAD-dependent thymidylate synthase [Rickettsiales bacterium]